MLWRGWDANSLWSGTKRLRSSRYPLIGMNLWSELESPALPSWAFPYGSGRFSYEQYPHNTEVARL
jgi:hypothetical protein